MKNFPENFAPVLRFGIKKPQKITLRNHRNLRELIFIQSKQFRHRLRHIAILRHDTPIRTDQFSIRFVGRIALSFFGWPPVFRIPRNLVFSPAISKPHTDIGRHIRRSIFGAQHIRSPRFSARFSIQSEHNGIEDCCLTRTRITCY